MASSRRPKDGVQKKFVFTVMPEVCALVPDFADMSDAMKFYGKVLRRKKVKDLIRERYGDDDTAWPVFRDLEYQSPNHWTYCFWQADHGPILAEKKHNPLEVLHLLAHRLQPVDTAMHKGEFGKLFLTLVESLYDADMKRQVKDILLNHKISTATKSPESRQRQSDAYHARRVQAVRDRFILGDDDDVE